MAVGTLRYWASARAAAGLDEESMDVDTLAEAVAEAIARHPDRPQLATILSICAYVVDGAPAGTRTHDSIALAPGWTAEALPPFAGG